MSLRTDIYNSSHQWQTRDTKGVHTQVKSNRWTPLYSWQIA